MSSIIKTNEIQNSSGGADVKIQALKHPSSSSNNITLASSGLVTMASGNGYRFAGIQAFTSTSDTTYTKSANVSAILVYVTGGGGGGGSSGTSTSYMGGAGAGGGTAIKWITSGIGSTESITVGAKGTGGATGNNAGGNGGTSSFGSPGSVCYCSATGGQGGVRGGSIGGVVEGGIGSNGTINLKGEGGDGGQDTNVTMQSLSGGNSFWSGGGAGRFAGMGQHGSHGSGGSGGEGHSANSAGGNGGDGIIVVYEYI